MMQRRGQDLQSEFGEPPADLRDRAGDYRRGASCELQATGAGGTDTGDRGTVSEQARIAVN